MLEQTGCKAVDPQPEVSQIHLHTFIVCNAPSHTLELYRETSEEEMVSRRVSTTRPPDGPRRRRRRGTATGRGTAA